MWRLPGFLSSSDVPGPTVLNMIGGSGVRGCIDRGGGRRSRHRRLLLLVTEQSIPSESLGSVRERAAADTFNNKLPRTERQKCCQQQHWSRRRREEAEGRDSGAVPS